MYKRQAQTKLMSQEANGEELETTFIMSHGQDTLMTTMLLRDEVKYFIDLYKQNLACLLYTSKHIPLTTILLRSSK